MLAKHVDLIIDSGHGGKDSGGGSNEHFLEKNFTLKMSLEQRRLFKKVGINPKMTRTSDKYLGPKTRTNLIKNSGAKYCISNHINSYTSNAIGAEVAYSIYSNGKWAKLTLDELVKQGAYRRRVFTRTYPGNKKLDYYYMHRDTGSVETIIIEYAFASNKNDTQKLMRDWKKYALAVVIAFCKYVNVDYSALEKSTSKPSENDFYLKIGMNGSKVKDLQENLINLGFSSYLKPYGADSYYGEKTRKAIIEFQKKYNLGVDGIAGVETLGKIDRLMKPKDYNRVIVNGKQVDAYLIINNAIERYEEEVKKAKKNDKVEIYYIGE